MTLASLAIGPVLLLASLLLLLGLLLAYPSKPRVVISLTTSPRRIHNLERVLCRLADEQEPPMVVDEVVLCLPRVFLRDASTFEDVLPDFVTRKHRSPVRVLWCDDVGPATKILPVAHEELAAGRPDTVVISVDDDIEYSRNFAYRFMRVAKMYPTCVVTGSSFLYDPDQKRPEYREVKNKLGLSFVQLLEGFSGVAYRARFLSELPVTAPLGECKACFAGDDLYLSNYIRGRRIPIVTLNYHIDQHNLVLMEYGLQADALHMGASGASNIQNYKTCVASLASAGRLYISEAASVLKGIE